MAVAGKFQVYVETLRSLADELLDVVADAGDLSEKRVADRVDDRGLAGARWSCNREEV